MPEKHDERLDSWKAIAEYLDRDPTTVMRWAKERGLPVHVVPGEGHRRRAVYAYKGEIDAWLTNPAPAGLHEDKQGEIPRPAAQNLRATGREARNDNRPADESLPELPVEVESANDVNSRARFLAPLGMTNITNGALSLRLGGRWGRWVVFLGGAFLIALAAGAWLAMPAPQPKVLGFEQLTNDGSEKGPGLATDGARVYFIENNRDGYVVAQIPSTGGSPAAIARANEDSDILDISPDRTELLLVEDARIRPGPVWILTLPAGSARRLGAVRALSAAWSPDGAEFAYTTDDGLYLCDAEGSNPRRIVAMSGRLDSVHWSPDGRRLCMARVSSREATTLWEVGSDGSGLRRLVENITDAGHSCFWTPDGNYLIFLRYPAGIGTPWALRVSAGLWTHNNQATWLGPASVSLAPATTSPDGSRLYGFGGTRSRFEIERFDAGSNQLAPFPPDIQGTNLDFTQDGQWVAYDDNDHASLWKSRPDGGGKVQLTLPPMSVELPRWSPDGKWIAFMGKDEGRRWKVRLVSAEGGLYGPVTSTDAAEGAPTWSPDGSRLAFGGLVDPADRAPGPLVIHIFDLKERRLSVVPGSEGLWTARWSPDGRYIAALTEDSRSLMLFDFRIGKWERVLSLGRIWDLRWSRQGKSLYLNAAPPGGEPALFRLKIRSRQAERLVGLKETESAGWLGLAPDDSPLVLRRVNGAEVYALQCQFPK